MQRDERAGEPAVSFLGEGRMDVARAKAGLDVADRNAAIEAGERCT
jgi:hypothetical protein